MEKRKYLIEVYGAESNDLITKYNSEIEVYENDPQDDEYYGMRLEEDAMDLFGSTEIMVNVFRLVQVN